jgi:hypothetical protein
MVKSMIDQNKSLHGFKLDTELSSRKASVFYNPNTGERVLSFKGTKPSDPSDLWTDLNLVFGTESLTSRFKSSEKPYQKVVDKYGTNNLKITGHSLGSSIGMDRDC